MIFWPKRARGLRPIHDQRFSSRLENSLYLFDDAQFILRLKQNIGQNNLINSFIRDHRTAGFLDIPPDYFDIGNLFTLGFALES